MRISDWSSDVCSSDLGVGEQRLAGAVLLDVVLVGAADVADDVRHQRAIGIAPGQVGLHAYPGEAPLVHREPCHLVGGQAQLQGHRAEAAVGLALLLEALDVRSEEHTSELQSLMRISYAVFCLTKKITLS